MIKVRDTVATSDDDGWETFVFRDKVYRLSDFTWTTPSNNELAAAMVAGEWEGYYNDSFISAIVIQSDDGYDTVVVGEFIL